MRIAIIGGGAAGLTAAWLLGQEHTVTLFERDARWGGHAYTLRIDDQGRAVNIEAGFEFFNRPGWPTFCRLLDALDVAVREQGIRLAVWRPGQRARIPLPVDVEGRFQLARLTPQRGFDSAQLALVMACATPIMKSRDTSLTLGQLLARVPIARGFRDEFLFPLLLSSWCVEQDELLSFSAYNVLRYAYMSSSLRGAVPMCEVEGGIGSYVPALLAQTPALILRSHTSIAGVVRHANELAICAQDGSVTKVDHAILCTNAEDSARLLRELNGTATMRAQLERMQYFPTTIAIHEDARYMPEHKEDWSVVNARWDGKHSQISVWKPWRSPRILRSWVTYDDALPERPHAVVHYRHPKVTPAYNEAQRALQALQGERGVWLAGLHMHDIDSHESAVCSAVNVVEKLAPDAPRLALLRGADA